MNWKCYDPKFECDDHVDPRHSGWHGHVFFAYDLVVNTKPEVIVELGTHKGHSFFSFSQAVKDNGLNSKLYAVDTWKGDEHAGFYGDEVYNVVQSVIEKYYGAIYTCLKRKTFDEAVSDFEDNSIDILHIDGLHTYQAVKHDFENWLPKMKKNGVVLFHDIAVKEKDFGVYRLWEELKRKYNFMEFYHSNGLGVLILDKNFLMQFFECEELLRNYYKKMSDYRTLSIILREKEKENDHIRKEIDQKENLNKKLHEEILLFQRSRWWKLYDFFKKK